MDLFHFQSIKVVLFFEETAVFEEPGIFEITFLVFSSMMWWFGDSQTQAWIELLYFLKWDRF